MEHVDWPFVILWLALILTAGQARLANARLAGMQRQMRALLFQLNVADPTAIPPASAQVRAIFLQRGKFAAVKAYWDETGASIGTCKKAVDELQEELRRQTA